MGLKKVEHIQKHFGKNEKPNEKDDINSKENVEKIEDTKEETYEIPPIMQIDYDELPDDVYNFAGLAELQNRKTRPNLRENEKLLKSKIKKEKKQKEKKQKNNNLLSTESELPKEHKNIVEEIFEAKKNNEENNIEMARIQKKAEETIIKENNKISEGNKILELDSKNKTTTLESNVQEIKNENNEEKQDKIDIENKVESESQEKVEKLEDNENTDISSENTTNENTNSKNTNIENITKISELNRNNEIIEESKINIPRANLEDFERINRDLESRKRRSKPKSSRRELIDEEDSNQSFSEKITNFCTSSKQFAFIVMFLLGVATQISFLATSRANNLIGILAITIIAISMFLVVNIIEIKSKILIFIISLIIILHPSYTEIFVTGENAIIYSFSILLSLFALNLVFVKRNKIINFVLAVTMFAIAYKIFKNCVYAFLVISIIKIIEEIFNKRERILNFLIHCLMICAILAVVIFL